MGSWQGTFLALSALPEVEPRLVSATPAWVWSRDGARLLWTNPAGGARVGAAKFAQLAKRSWPENHPLRRSLETLADAVPEKGTLARLRLGEGVHGVPIACHCRLVRSGAVRGLLVVAAGEMRQQSSVASLAAFLSDIETSAVIFAADGSSIAGDAPAGSRDEGPGDIAFEADGRRLRLRLFQRRLSPGPTGIAPPVISDSAEERAPSAEPGDQAAEERSREDVPPTVSAGPVTAAREALPEAPAAETAEQNDRAARPIVAGRVPRELSRQPVRFLWQTDAADRFLFVSPGLAQVVGRNSEIAGERWHEVAARLRLDPGGRIGRALQQHDTWSGLTAWWPVEGSGVRVPAELTGLPVFGADQSFQGFRGFGVLKPAEALMPAAFETRYGSERPAARGDQTPPYEEAVSVQPAKVVPIRSEVERPGEARLSAQERSAFEEIAAALKSRVVLPSPEEEPENRAAAQPPTALTPQSEIPPPPVVRLLQRVAGALAEEPASSKRGAETSPGAPPAPLQEAPPATAPADHRSDALRERLSDAERRLREMTAILDTATDGVVILDAGGVVESVNASAEALFGLEANELEGKKFVDLLTEESRQAASDYLSGLRDSGVASLLNEGREVEARAGVGAIPLFMTMGRVSSEEGGRFCAVLRDITHWKRTEADLLAARRAAESASHQKSDFLARVSHEVRTPLNAIIGFAEVMIEERFGAVENERYREYLRDIRTSGEHVVSLVNDLLDISRIEAGKLDLTFQAVPLNDLVRESIGLMQPQANRAHVVLRSSLSRDVPAIVADQRTLRQIVLNLLSNSVKFTGAGGQVIASTSLAESGEAHLRIRDTGEGMNEEELALALEPFRQLSTAAIGGGTGSGLGLPLTKALVEANRASLSIKSARGEGTVVTVTFPPTRVLSE
jgi:PAS domain S-box-containing protein